MLELLRAATRFKLEALRKRHGLCCFFNVYFFFLVIVFQKDVRIEYLIVICNIYIQTKENLQINAF